MRGCTEGPGGGDDRARLSGGRLIVKRTTGMVMAIQPGQRLAIGDLRTHLNQGINLVNSCFAQIVMRRGHLLLHASGVSWNGRTAALGGSARRRQVYGVAPARRAGVSISLE